MSYLFTSEYVAEGHPDKVADQISDAILDEFLRQDRDSKVACETLVTTGLVVLSGEVRSEDAYVDVQHTAREVIRSIGYTKGEYMFESNSCGVISTLHEQSPDINQGVVREKLEEQGAGDQGMMFGYATNETPEYMPLPLMLSRRILRELKAIRLENKEMLYLRPDAKSQVTIEYDDANKPVRIDTIVVSTQHDEFDADDAKMLEKIRLDVKNILLPRVIATLLDEHKQLFKEDFVLHVNPTGKFVIGGPHGDTGLTGRKIIVDTYGGFGAHGGGAFSGKDPSKVDRSAAYAVRHIAKNVVAAGIADRVLIQVAYAIGVAQPVSLHVNTYGTSHLAMTDGELAKELLGIFDLRPYAVIERLKLRNPIYRKTASMGHFGIEPFCEEVNFGTEQKPELRSVEYFTWEKLDYVERLKKHFKLTK